MTGESIFEIVIILLTAMLASSGMWAFLERKTNRKDDKVKLLLGLAHDRIVSLGMVYIDRGFITKDEYEDFHTYLYDPYKTFGGNGLAEKVAEAVSRLPFGPIDKAVEIDEKVIENVKPQNKPWFFL